MYDSEIKDDMKWIPKSGEVKMLSKIKTNIHVRDDELYKKMG